MKDCVLIFKIILAYKGEVATINPSDVLIEACLTHSEKKQKTNILFLVYKYS